MFGARSADREPITGVRLGSASVQNGVCSRKSSSKREFKRRGCGSSRWRKTMDALARDHQLP